MNYFDVLYRGDNTYVAGFQYLSANKIPFIRFMATPGYWPIELAQYQANKRAYFVRMDALVQNAEKYHIGLIPNLFWNPSAVSDLVGEPMDQWGNPNSKTIAWMKEFTTEMVTRYKDSPAIWGWEFANEFTDNCIDPPVGEEVALGCWPGVSTAEGTPPARTVLDDLTGAQFESAVTTFAQTVRAIDPHRALFTGNDLTQNDQYNRTINGTMTTCTVPGLDPLEPCDDTVEQYGAITTAFNPSPIDTLTMHMYPWIGDTWWGPDYHESKFAPEGNATTPVVIAATMGAGAAVGKPLFIGEWGAAIPGDPQTEQFIFERMLTDVMVEKVPLSSIWVFDFAFQGPSNGGWDITPTNSRSYQLTDIIKANAQIRAELQ